MSKITGLKAIKGREKRIEVSLDSGLTVELLAGVALEEGLRVGQPVTDAGLVSLAAHDRFQRCLNAAVRFLGYRPRSEADLKQRLRKHGFDTDCIEKALARLRERGLIDDTEFARFWKDNRNTFRPRSRRLVRLELQRQGLDRDIIEQITSEIDDGDAAYRAALARAKRLPLTDFQGFRRQLGQYLLRRGFGWDIIETTVTRVWQEKTEENNIQKNVKIKA
ncbi:MAG: hypothetical protein A2Z29_08890 [Chloroflexi bacterium RBG_16_56_11]|nr:MAG: hypothetical protein A2Z29_08890 [Chloroflexi bacterium RBG_16_56_11]